MNPPSISNELDIDAPFPVLSGDDNPHRYKLLMNANQNLNLTELKRSMEITQNK
jgi:hypothetical protein